MYAYTRRQLRKGIRRLKHSYKLRWISHKLFNTGIPRMDRKSHLLAKIAPDQQAGLEIGALCRPIVAPGSGPVRYVDHMSTPELRIKYATDPNVDIEQIVDVSYVWGKQSLPEAVGDERFDYVVASHVIEHVPDTVGWLREIGAVLKPGGMLSLAIPDMRYTFDCLRTCTTFADLVESYMEKRRHPSFRQVLDHFSEAAAVPSAVTTHAIWAGGHTVDEVPLAHPTLIRGMDEEELRDYYEQITSGELYMDVHCHVFTPRTFMKILERLAGVGMLEYRVAAFFDTLPGEIEFFVTLEKLPPDLNAQERESAILASLPRLPAEKLAGANADEMI